ncbi:MAG: hypothetical protein KDK70_15660 [Myxococcales bacterium]|nr:hypothetical protein [Myxococcales bacterium]
MRAAILLMTLASTLGACKDQAPKGEAKGEAKGEGEAKGDGPVGALSTYKAKTMASEAKVNVAGIVSRVRLHFEEERMDPSTLTVTTGTLPKSAPLTPPAGTCCKQPDGKCPPDLGDWSHETWKALQFQPADPHRYSYEVVVEGQQITVRAVGDLDCDGETSTYESVGTVVDGALQFSPELTETSPLE